MLTPLDLERDFGLTGGHVLHGEPGLDQFFAWRPLLGFARYRMPVERLYLCGSGAHPGGGITGAPGANAAREILSDLSSRRSMTPPPAGAARAVRADSTSMAAEVIQAGRDALQAMLEARCVAVVGASGRPE